MDGEAPSHLVVARVLGSHGLRGELSCLILTEFPQRFRKTRQVFFGDPPVRYSVKRARLRGTIVLLSLEGVESVEAAVAMRGLEVLVAREEAVKLPAGRFYWHEVIGLEVRDEEGRTLGVVADILETGANDVYVVRTPNGELLLPAIQEVVRLIDPPSGTMTVRLLPGMENGRAP